jgi:hypothetical protein
MDRLTVTGLDDELSASLHRLAQEQGISVNQAALKLLRKGAALTDGKEGGNKVGSSLDHLFGMWTTEEADEIDAALQELETIDESAWR